MLSGKVLNSQATLNNYIELASLNFIPGEAFTLVTQLFNTQLNIRYMVENIAATAKIILNKANGETEEVVATFMSGDRSILIANISSAISSEILGGSFQIEIDVNGDTTEIKKAYVYNALAKQSLGGC